MVACLAAANYRLLSTSGPDRQIDDCRTVFSYQIFHLFNMCSKACRSALLSSNMMGENLICLAVSLTQTVRLEMILVSLYVAFKPFA